MSVQTVSVSTLKIAIADDEPLARLRLQQLCDDLKSDCPNEVLVSYAHGSALMQAVAKQLPNNLPNVLLLDINMPGLSGMEVAAALAKHAPGMAIVFVSAEPEHAVEAFELAAVDYVLKPVRAGRLLKALNKARALIDSRQTNVAPVLHSLTVQGSNGSQSLLLDDILYFKANHKTTLVRTAQASFNCTQSLADLELWLAALNPSDHSFVRVHRNSLARRSALSAVLEGEETTLQVLGVPDALHVSRRMLANVLSDLKS